MPPIRTKTPLGTRVDLATNKRIDQQARAQAVKSTATQTVVVQQGTSALSPGQLQQIVNQVLAALGGFEFTLLGSFDVPTYGAGPYPFDGTPLGGVLIFTDSLYVPSSFVTESGGLYAITSGWPISIYDTVEIWGLMAIG